MSHRTSWADLLRAVVALGVCGVAFAQSPADTDESAYVPSTLAKTALLSGPERGRELLESAGGVLVLDDGEVMLAGPLRERARDAT